MILSTTDNTGYARPNKSSVSHILDTGEHSPSKNISRQPQHLELPPTDGLVDLKFCSNSKVLIAVTTPYRDKAGQSTLYSIRTWDVINRRRVSYIDSKNEVCIFGKTDDQLLTNRPQGSDDLGDIWKVRSLAIIAYQSSFVTISRKKIHLGTYDPPKYDIFTNTMGDQLLDVLVDEDVDQLILIGKTDWRGKINAFKVSVDKVKGLESLGHGTPTGVEQYDSLRDACCIKEKSDGKVLLVASLDTRKRNGKWCEIPLDQIR